MANPQEHELTYVLGDTLPASGHTLEIAPGIRWLRMGLPFALDHINLWLVRDELEGRQGWTIIDCGIANDATRAAWERIFDEELDGLPVLRVIVTHMHPDHIGLAHWLTERWSTPEWPCRLWISLSDWNAARMASLSTTGFGGEAAAAFFGSHGVTDLAALDKVRQRGNYYSGMVPDVPRQFRRMLEGQRLTMGGHVWTCHAGHGHAPEHISLHCEALGVLVSGDMVLPRISTNISVIDIEPEGDPLPLYLASIERMRCLPADTLVLPAHGKPFRGLHPRIQQLQDHHTDRLADVMAACALRPHSAFEILPVLFRRELDLHQLTFAMGEAIAHLHALWLDGDLQRVRQADGVWRFGAV